MVEDANQLSMGFANRQSSNIGRRKSTKRVQRYCFNMLAWKMVVVVSCATPWRQTKMSKGERIFINFIISALKIRTDSSLTILDQGGMPTKEKGRLQPNLSQHCSNHSTFQEEEDVRERVTVPTCLS